MIHCYSTAAVSGDLCVGGLVGHAYFKGVNGSFWDTQTSGQVKSTGGTGKTTPEMQMAKTFLDAGWDFVSETANGSEDIWRISEGFGYPRLAWEKYSGGSGTAQDPYQIATAADLILLGDSPGDYDKHFILTADIDLDPNLPGGKVFDKAVIAPDTDHKADHFQGTCFTGVFDGNGHKISHLTIKGKDHLGLFGFLASGAEVRNLGVLDVNIVDSGTAAGGLVGYNGQGTVIRCYSTGAVSGRGLVGGLVGENHNRNHGALTQCHSTGAVSGGSAVGGLVGGNFAGTVTQCYSTGPVSGDLVGGLVGMNDGTVTHCYSTGAVSGTQSVGGLVGGNVRLLTQCYSTGAVSGGSDVGGLAGYNDGGVARCYSTGAVRGTSPAVGGLAGCNDWGEVTACFWDTQASGRATSDGGTGKTTAERNADGQHIPCRQVGLRGRDGQRHGGHLVDSRREGLSAPVVGSRKEMRPQTPSLRQAQGRL